MACAVQSCLASCAKFDSSKTNLPVGSAGPFYVKDFPYRTQLGNTNVVLGINYVNTKEFTIDFHLMNTDGQGCFAEVRRAGNLAPLTSAWKVVAHNDCRAIDDRRIPDSFDQGE